MKIQSSKTIYIKCENAFEAFLNFAVFSVVLVGTFLFVHIKVLQHHAVMQH